MNKHFRYAAVATVLLAVTGCSNGSGNVSDTPPVDSGGPAQPVPPTQPPPPPETPPAPPPSPPPEPPPESPPSVPPPVPTPTPPELPELALAGYWEGTVTRPGRSPMDARAFVAKSGEAQLLVLSSNSNDDFVLHGPLCCDDEVEQSMTAIEVGERRTEEADLKGEIDDGAFAGEFELDDRDYRFSLDRNSESNQRLTLSDLVGVYTRTTDDGVSTVAINVDGQITGALPDGCAFSGTVSVPDSTRNMIDFAVQMTNCGQRFNGSYAGLGVLLREAAQPELRYSLVGPTWFGPQSVIK